MGKKDGYFSIVNLFNKININDRYLVVKSMCLINNIGSNESIDTNKVKIKIGEYDDIATIKFKKKTGLFFIKGYKVNSYELKIDLDKIKSGDVDNFDSKVDVLYDDNANFGKIRYSIFKSRRAKIVSNMIKCSLNKVIYLRKSIYGNLYLVKKEKPGPAPLIINLYKSLKRDGNRLIIKGFCFTKIIRTKEKLNLADLKLDIAGENDNIYQTNIEFKYKKGLPFVKGYKYNRYRIILDIHKILNLDIQNKLILNYKNKYYGRIIYSAFDLFVGKYRTSKVIEKEGIAIYLRQTIVNTMYLTVRESNVYDFRDGIRFLNKAKFLSRFVYKPNLVLMYEKECDRYEESASVLYEKIIDLGYRNVYYIMNKNNPKYDEIDDKYKKNIIDKGSLKHLIYFFKCNRFVGTETIGHAIQLRASNRVVSRKVNSSKIRYVFLQHGVMYMVSLDADMRSGFRSNNYKLYKVVVSSELEKRHFTDLGGFSDDELYVTGLAKFDRCARYDNADKIVIMPTWRRWETNQASSDFTKTKYYKMMERMVSAVPEKYRDKLIVLPHPLMKKVMSDNESKLSKYMVSDDVTYDDVLKTCDLLITDYSSIAYDAFYRGAKVIFYWEEKDECMKHYGGNAHLMLNSDNVYGDICYNKEELKKVFVSNYMKPQKDAFVKKYKKIVEFSDGKNSERIINCLKKDKMLK